MNKYFFSYYKDIPSGMGFALFGPGHLSVLAVIAALDVLICLLYMKLPRRRRRALELGVAWSVLGLDLVKYAYFLAVHVFDFDILPLHLCGLAVYITFFNAVRPGRIKQEILYSLCMPGAAMALLFPAWTAYPIVNIVSITCFLIHGLLVVYPLMLFFGGQLRPDWRNLPKCLLFLAAVSVPIYFFNRIFGTNFLFINGPLPDSPLDLFAAWFGNPGYLFGVLLMIFAVWAVLYLPLALTGYLRAARQK